MFYESCKREREKTEEGGEGRKDKNVHLSYIYLALPSYGILTPVLAP